MELAVIIHDDGTYGLAVDGIPRTDDIEGQPLYARETIEQVLADAVTLFGGHADTITTPEPPRPPLPSPVDSQGNIVVENFDPTTAAPGPAPPAPVEPNPVPPAVAPPSAPTPDATPPTPPPA